MVLTALLLASSVASLVIGATSIVGGDVAALLGARGDRTAVGALVGASIAVSGATLQGLLRNPLADPGILGINSGAALLVVVGITAFGVHTLPGFVVCALLGAALAAAAVLGLASAAGRALGGTSPLGLALAGMVLSAGATSVASAVLIASGQPLDVYRYWQVGSVAGRRAVDAAVLLPLFVLGFALVQRYASRLDVLALGDDVAQGLGERPARLRLVIGGGALLLAAASVALSGPIAFVGLVAPHVVRPFAGVRHARLLPASGLLGAIIVVLADTLGRVVAPPTEVQVGIMTAFLGCPALLWVLKRTRAW